MRKYIVVATLFMVMGVYAQENAMSLYERVNAIEKKTDKFNLYFNFQSSLDVIAPKEQETQVAFKARQLRLEIKGDLTDNLFYRFRHRLNKSNAGQSLDNLAKATDMMYVGYRFNHQFTLIGGKQCQSWGGFEFDLNPMNIYEYSDFIENMDNFMVGATLIYTPLQGQEFQFQVTDARNSKANEIYEGIEDLEPSAHPLTYILNWNGNLLNNILQTRWAYGIETEAKDKYSYMLTLGNKLNLPQFQLAVDYMHATQDIDRLGYATQAATQYLAANHKAILENVKYDTYIAKAEYQPSPEWNIFAKGAYETASLKDDATMKEFRKSYSYFGGIEYKPLKGEDLRLFLAYVGRKFHFKDNTEDYTHRVSLGMMYRIKAF